MGGDHAPLEIVAGTLSWARAHPSDSVVLVGVPERVREVAGGPIPPNVEIVAASQVVEMDESPALALKAKRDSSIMVAMDLIKQGRADALVTAGHSGAGMAAAVLKLGRLPGVDRPALAVQMVTETGPFVLLDIGANMDSSGFNLYQFAHMGSLYAERVLGVPNPRVALLSIGEERGKGDQAVQQATQLLDDDAGLNFIGNVEGRDLVKHMADVAVCDAMVGNVTMKFFEGLVTFMGHLWEREFRRLPLGPIGYLFMKPGAGRIRALFDYETLGASPLLGVKGMVLITHGSAKRRMIEFALDAGATAARARIPDLIADAFRGQSRHPERQVQ
jgi:glycerol-3-phosphate acyltransferase PlsX